MSLRRSRLLPAITRIVCLMVAAASVVGLYFVSSASATAASSSAVTVKWADDSSAVKQYQPTRSAASPLYAGFKDISVTVDQTTAITDQAVRVHVTGFAGTRAKTDYNGMTWSSAQNFFQAMQCWGKDPLAANFAQTCEWGGRYVDNNGLGNSVYLDNIPRVATKDIPPTAANATDVPFLPYGSTVPITGRQVVDGDSTSYPLLDLFGPSTTNEVQSARINADGSGVFDFETQSAYQAPQLGCGQPGQTRCWLVLVPRGSVYGGHDDSCSSILDNSNDPYTYGRADSIQAGSPVNPNCDYWANRIDIPLDFTPIAGSCKVGNTERRTVGSQLLVGAMASWQPQLCTDLSKTYTLSTNPDSVARAQLVEAQAGMAFTSFPVTKSELEDDVDKASLATTDIGYAPVAVTSADIAFLAEGPGGRITSLTLSPRLMAKLLTQSYRFELPATTADPSKNIAHLGVVNQRYSYLFQDPDFQALNPNYAQFSTNPALVLPGPAGADAIRQVWKWILGDAQAVKWLGGAPDESGMTINPYYLPKGNPAAIVPMFIANSAQTPVPCPASRPDWADYTCRNVGLSNVDGSPFQIGTQLEDGFLKADESLVPISPPAGQTRFGSIQSSPYSDTFLTAARTAFRADPGAKTIWDSTAITTNPTPGDYVSSGPQILGQRFMIAITDAPSVERYDLTSAGLRLDNSTAVVGRTDASLNAALASDLQPTEIASIRQVDPAKATDGQYPLTTVVYAAVNLTESDTGALADFSNFISQVTTKGQIQGTEAGQLPPGYVPLTPELSGQAQVAAAAIKAYIAPADGGGDSNGPAQDDYSGSYGGDGGPGADGAGAGAGGVGPSSSPAPSAAPGRTPAVTSGLWVSQVALGGSLATGLAGAVFSPLFFRGRRLLP